MSLDGVLLHFVKEELSELIGSRVEKIYQPSKDELLIALRMLSGGRYKLIFSANPASARVCLTEAEFDNPQTPPMFCMLMRKHLQGGKLVGIRQDGLDRILCFDFECINEIGDVVINTLCAEIMGRSANIILLRGERVIDSIKRVSDETSRRILPNIIYEVPPRQERLDIFEAEPRGILSKLENSRERLSKALIAVLEGIAPVFARECAFYVAGDVDAVCCELTDEQKERLCEFIESAKNAPKFTEVIDEQGKKKELSFVDIKQYGDNFKRKTFETANALVDDFYARLDAADRIKQRARDLLKTVNNAYERTLRKIEIRKKELAECGEREKFRVCGDLINANIYRIEKGMTKFTAEDFYSGETREIALDARLTPAKNAQKYYAEYRKLCNAEEKLSELIKESENELIYLDSVLDCLCRAQDDGELSEIRRELSEQGYIRGGRQTGKPDKKLSEPLKYISCDGYEILVGRNNKQNDMLTLKTAKASDIWLHVKDIAGSHVIIRTNGSQLSEETIFEAAQLAAYHSKGRESSNVPVDYTAVKYVKKPAGAKPGMVIFTNNKTLYITPDESVIEKLRGKD